MEISLHGACCMHANVATDVEVATSTGYDGIEIWLPKLRRYLDGGFSARDLADTLGSLRVTMIDVLLPIERSDPEFRRELARDCDWISRVANELGCHNLQVVALDNFDGDDWPFRRRALISSLSELAELAHPHGVRLALEPVTFSPFRELSEALEVVEAVGSDQVGLVLDTWHLWTTGVPWEEVASVDPDWIACAHISDTSPKAAQAWRDEDRGVLPGDGILPLQEGVDAIRRTGYDGIWSVEMFSKTHSEWEPHRLARALLDRAQQLLVRGSEEPRMPPRDVPAT